MNTADPILRLGAPPTLRAWLFALVILIFGVSPGAPAAQTADADAAFARQVFGDVNAPRPVETDDGETIMLLPVEIAAARADAAGARMLRALKAAGADVNKKDPAGRAAVHIAAMWGADENMTVLHELGADLNARDGDGDTPLHIAVGKANPALVETLLRLGAAPDPANNKGETPLLLLLANAGAMIQFGRVSSAEVAHMVDALAKAGADPNAALPGNRRTALMLAAFLPKESASPVVKAILAAGADPNRQDAAGRTALHLAIEADTGHGNSIAAMERADLAVVQLLLQAGADPNVQDSKGRTPLHAAAERACSFGEKEAGFFDALVAAGADPDIRDAEGRSPRDFPNCGFLADHLRKAAVAGGAAAKRTRAPAAGSSDSGDRKQAVIGKIKSLLTDSLTAWRKTRTKAPALARLDGLDSDATARARADFFKRYRDEVLAVLTWKEEGRRIISRVAARTSVTLTKEETNALLAFAFGTAPPEDWEDEPLRAEYYWAESWEQLFTALAEHPEGWRPGDGGEPRITDEELANQVAALRKDAKVFASAIARDQ